jgi:hypothetical protein
LNVYSIVLVLSVAVAVVMLGVRTKTPATV